MTERECVDVNTGEKVEEPEPEGWIEEMVKDIDAILKRTLTCQYSRSPGYEHL